MKFTILILSVCFIDAEYIHKLPVSVALYFFFI